MSIKDEDLIKGGEDVVKSSLAKAYEDGVTTYGTRPEDTRILEEILTAKSNSVSTFEDIPGNKSATINTAKQQKIASFQLDVSEVDDILDLISANQAEAALDSAIVSRVIGDALVSGDDDLVGRLQQMFERKNEGMLAATQAILGFTTFARRLNTYTSLLAKGNFLKSTVDFNNTEPPESDPNTFSPRVYTCFDEVFWNKVKHSSRSDLDANLPQVLGGSSMLSGPGTLQKICYGADGNVASAEALGNFSLSAIIAQACVNAEFCMDYGLPLYFFKDILDMPSIIGSSASKLDLTIIPFPAFPQGAELGDIPKIHELFDYHHSLSERGLPNPTPGNGQSCTQIITSTGYAGTDAASDKHLRHPIFSIPRMEGWALYDKLNWLCGVVDRELTLSSGLRMMRPGLGLGGGSLQLLVGGEVFNNIGSVPASQATGEGTFATSLGNRLFGTIAGARLNQPPYLMAAQTHPAGLGQATKPLRIPIEGNNPLHEVPEGGGINYSCVMPFETADPEDADYGSFISMGNPQATAATKTLKTVVIDPLLEDPKNNAAACSVRHTQFASKIVQQTQQLDRVMGELCLAGHHQHQAVSLGTTNPSSIDHEYTAESKIAGQASISRMLMSTIHEHLGEMIIHAQYCKGGGDPPMGNQTSQGKQAISDCLALTSFLQPNDTQDASQKYVKTRFVKRLCELDLLRHVRVPPNQSQPSTLGDPGGEDLFFDPLPLVYFPPDNRLKHPSEFVEETIELYKKSMYVQSQLSDADIPPAPDVQFATNYFDIDAPDRQGVHQYGVGIDAYSTDLFKTVFYIARQFQKGTGPHTASTSQIWNATNTNGGAFAISQLAGHEIINYVFGPHPGGQPPTEMNMTCLMSRIIKIADRLEDCLWAKQSYRPGGSNSFFGAVINDREVSCANGMDRSQLLSYILEMFILLANDVLESDFLHGGSSAQRHWAITTNPPEGEFMAQSAAQFWKGNHPGGGIVDNWNHHLVVVAPKKSNIRFINQNAAVPGSETIVEMLGAPGPAGGAGGHIPSWIVGNPVKPLFGVAEELPMIALGLCLKNAGHRVNEDLEKSKSFEEFYQALLHTLSSVLDLTATEYEDYPQYFDQGLGAEFSDALLGSSLTLSDFYKAMTKAAEYSSALSYTFSPYSEMMGLFRNVYSSNTSELEAVPPVMEAILDIINETFEDLELSDNTINNFVKKISNFSIRNAFFHALDQEVMMGTTDGITNTVPAPALSDVTNLPAGMRSGVNGGKFSKNMKKAIELVLDTVSQRAGQSQFINVLFLGFNFQKLKDDAIHMITRDAFLNSSYEDILTTYEITFERHSEANTDVEFSQDMSVLEPIRLALSLGLHKGVYGISDAIENLPYDGTFDDLVELTKYTNVSVSNTKYKTNAQVMKTGAEYITEGSFGGAQETRKILENKIFSCVFQYMFESLTGMTVGHRLSYDKNQVHSGISIRNFLDSIKKTDIVLDKDELLSEAGDLSPAPIHRAGQIELNFNTNDVMDHLFETPSEYEGALSDPVQIVTDPNELKKAFQPILVREGLEARFEDPPVSQELYLILQSYLRSQWSCVDQYQSCLDESIFRSCLFDHTEAIITNNLSDENAFSINIEKSFPQGVNQEVIDQVNDPNFRLDNYKVHLRQKISKTEF